MAPEVIADEFDKIINAINDMMELRAKQLQDAKDRNSAFSEKWGFELETSKEWIAKVEGELDGLDYAKSLVRQWAICARMPRLLEAVTA